jgi:hypothetical protein
MTTKKETSLQALGLVARIVLCPITLVFIWSAIAGPPKSNAPGNEGMLPIELSGKLFSAYFFFSSV